ncbi:MAG: GIY-YIG nuclease family protein [Bacteroidia bacterium]
MTTYYVYILLSDSFKKTYVGYTSDLAKRLNQHNSKKVPYTSRFTPWKIIYSESLDSKENAMKREKYFKSGAGRRQMKVIFNNLENSLKETCPSG